GQFDQAIDEYEKTIKLDPRNVKAQYNLGVIYKNRKLYDKAIQQFNEAKRISPKYSKAYYSLGDIYRLKGKYDFAIQEFKKAALFNPKNAGTYLGLGMIYSNQKKDKEKATYYYRKYLELKPTGSYSDKIRNWLKQPAIKNSY
ncbi:MAG: tetratricopeptide repeat protein, partial [Candidatus Theseobacter exili]|nr:tetratricopeptide repeat protein [Candidatus Theseobacter exili]